jgi:hypothetical protein
MVAAFLLKPDYFVLGIWSGLDTLMAGDIGGGLYELRAQIVTLVIILLVIAWYYITKNAQKARGINVEYAFKEIPPE